MKTIMVYKFRVILDTEEDIFRDIAILEDDTLEDLHNAIVNALDSCLFLLAFSSLIPILLKPEIFKTIIVLKII